MKGEEKRHGVVVVEGHVQGLANTRLLGKKGLPVIIVDKADCIARYSKYCTKFFVCPDYVTDGFVQFLIELCVRENLYNWVILPSNDHAVYSISKHKTELSKYYKIITESIEVIKKIYNKRDLLTIAQNAGIPIPQTVMPEVANPMTVNLRYPVIVKGNNGLSFYKKFKCKAVFLSHQDALKETWKGLLKEAQPHEYFIQEVIPPGHKTVSVAVFSIDGIVKSYWMGVKLREHPVTFGTATCCKSTIDHELLELSERLIAQIGFTGVCEIEWLKDIRDNEPKLIEINARTWLWVGLAAVCGVNFPWEVYRYMNDNQPPTPTNYKTDKVWINLFTDLAYTPLRLVKRIDSFRSIIDTYKNFTEACWDPLDKTPFVKYAQFSYRFLKNR